jgi:hypothetical protein
MKNFWLLIFSLILVGSGCKSEVPVNVEAPVINEPLAEFSMETVTFGEVPVLSTANDQAIKIKNIGANVLSLGDLTIDGDFLVESRCKTSLEANQLCYLIVGFAPTVAGERTGTLTVTSNSPDSPKLIPLSGTGLSTALFVSPKSINFGEVIWTAPLEVPVPAADPNPEKPAQAVITVKNIGSQKLPGLKVSNQQLVAGPFAQTNTCPDLLEAGETCFITVTFIPTAVGEFSDKFFISSATTAATTVSLSGQAVEDPAAEPTSESLLPTQSP